MIKGVYEHIFISSSSVIPSKNIQRMISILLGTGERKFCYPFFLETTIFPLFKTKNLLLNYPVLFFQLIDFLLAKALKNYGFLLNLNLCFSVFLRPLVDIFRAVNIYYIENDFSRIVFISICRSLFFLFMNLSIYFYL